MIDSDPQSPICPLPLLHGSTPVGIAPYYWQYDGCICEPGHTANYTRVGAAAGAAASSSSSGGAGAEGPITGMVCEGQGAPPRHSGQLVPWWGIVVAVLGGLLLAGVLLVLAYRLVPSVVRYRALLAKRMPPGGWVTRGSGGFRRRVGGR
jgi:hypothetical protein